MISFTGSLSRAAGETVLGSPYLISQNDVANSNYTITYNSADLTITTLAVTVTADAKSKTYGDVDPALTFVSAPAVGTTLANGEVISFTGSLSRAIGEDVRAYAINQGDVANSNYTISYTGAKLNITALSVSVTADSQAKVYGEVDPALTFVSVPAVSSVLANGEKIIFTGSLTRAIGEDVGAYAINQNTLANSNYTISYTGSDLTITKKLITVTADDQSKEYGHPNPPLTFTYEGFTNGETSSVLTKAPVVATDATIISAIGTYPIVVSSGEDDNYSFKYVNGVLTIEEDVTVPSVVVSTTSLNLTNIASIPVTITFSEAVSGFTIQDLTLVNGTATNFVAVNESTYTVTIIPIINGIVSVSVGTGVAADPSNNPNTASNLVSVAYDNASPTVVVSTTVSSITNSSPIPVRITFSEAVTGFAIGDLSIVNGTVRNFVSISATTYTVDLVPSSNGSVLISVPASSAKDAAQIGNTASNIIAIEFDNRSPSVSFSSIYSDSTFFPSFPVIIQFSEPIIGFDLADIGLINANAEDFQKLNDSSFTVTIKPGVGGMVTVSLGAGDVTDAATNSNLAAEDFRIVYFPLPDMQIRPIITPGLQDDENNVLVIDHVQYYKDNNLKLMNRWGAVLKEWTNFQNYTTTYSDQPDFNFTELNQGEYMCVLDYTNPVTGKRDNLVKMIMVLK